MSNLRITRRGRMVAWSLVIAAGATLGMVTHDWQYYSVNGSHSIKQLILNGDRP